MLVRGQALKRGGADSAQEARSQERQRIAAELHDGVGQHLCLIKMMLERALNKTGSGSEAERDRCIASAVSGISDALSEIRSVVEDLKPSILTGEGIKRAIEHHCGLFKAAFPGIRLSVRFDAPMLVHLSSGLALAIIRILQEALYNAGIHARPMSIEVELEQTESGLQLLVCDDGRGFDAGNALGDGYGLSNMRERAVSTQGVFSLVSQPGRGSRLSVIWPGGLQDYLEISPFSIA